MRQRLNVARTLFKCCLAFCWLLWAAIVMIPSAGAAPTKTVAVIEQEIQAKKQELARAQEELPKLQEQRRSIDDPSIVQKAIFNIDKVRQRLDEKIADTQNYIKEKTAEIQLLEADKLSLDPNNAEALKKAEALKNQGQQTLQTLQTQQNISLANQLDQLNKTIPCWSCELIKGIVVVSVRLGKPAFDLFKDGLISLIGITVGILILWNAGKLLMPFSPLEGGRKVLNEVVVLLGLGLFTIGILSSLDFVWRYLYAPTISVSMNLSDAVMAAGGSNTSANCASGAFAATDIVAQSTELGERLSCRIAGISEQINNGMRLGWAMIVSTNSAWYEINPFDNLSGQTASKLFMRLLLTISGILLMVVFLYASATFLFAIIDVIMRWTFLFVLSPLMVAAFTFKPTRGFSTFGFKGLAEAMMTLTLMTIVATVTSLLIVELGSDPTDASRATPDIEGYILGIAQGTATPPTLNTPQFGKILIIGLLAGALIFKIKNMGAQLVGGGLALAVASGIGEKWLNEKTFRSALNQTAGRLGSKVMENHLQNRQQETGDRTLAQAQDSLQNMQDMLATLTPNATVTAMSAQLKDAQTKLAAATAAATTGASPVTAFNDALKTLETVSGTLQALTSATTDRGALETLGQVAKELAATRGGVQGVARQRGA
jgi:hypothetical protein